MFDKMYLYDIFGPMNKTNQNFSNKKDTVTASSALFLSFCHALDKYCDQIGINNRRFSAARILHEAACNTVSHMYVVSPAQRRHMAQMEREIPEMFAGLIEISATDGCLSTIERMSKMSLAQVAATIAQNTHKR